MLTSSLSRATKIIPNENSTFLCPHFSLRLNFHGGDLQENSQAKVLKGIK